MIEKVEWMRMAHNQNNMINDIINGKLIKFESLFCHKDLLKNYHKYLLTKTNMYILHKSHLPNGKNWGFVGKSEQSIKKLSTGKNPYFKIK
jgi:hypothetical protein